jgi:hypothetical protein
MRFGVRKEGGSLDAHAWLEFDGIALLEDDTFLGNYTQLTPAILSPRNTPNQLR